MKTKNTPSASKPIEDQYIDAIYLAAEAVTDWMHHARPDYPLAETETAFAFFTAATAKSDYFWREQTAKSIIMHCIAPLTRAELHVAEATLLHHARFEAEFFNQQSIFPPSPF